MATGDRRLPHLQRPVYSAAEPVSTEGPSAPRPSEAPREPKIQSESLPRPKNRYDTFLGQFTAMGQAAPPPNAFFTVKEQGVSNPRFLRMSCPQIALEDSAQKNIGLPVGAVWQPLADQEPGDDPVPMISRPPFRCTRCFAYVNPHFRFVEGGRKVVCNICGLVQESPEDYFADRTGKSELYSGTYEFPAPPEYSVKPPMEPMFFFCLDVSEYSLHLGLPQQVISSVKGILDYIPAQERTRVGLMTYDTKMHFYRISEIGELTEIVVTDINDPFVPDPIESLTFNVSEDREKLDNVLDKLADWTYPQPSKQIISAGAVVEAFKNYFMKGRGGRLIVFSTQLGTVGKHQLPMRNDPKAYNTDKEKLMYQSRPEYTTLGQECVNEDLCVDVFVCASSYVDVASLGSMCSQTGGDLYLYPGFTLGADAERLHYQLVRILTRVQGFQVVMRARVSNGLAVETYLGKYRRRGPIEMEASCVDSDKSIAIVLKHDEKLQPDTHVYLQCVILYTNQFGQKMLRIFNGIMLATSYIGNVIKSGDSDCLANLISKNYGSMILEQSLSAIREAWHSAMIKLLYSHRNTIDERNDFSKILVPESLKLLPLYCNTSMKLPVFSLSGVYVDLRLYSMHNLLSMGVHQSRLLFYPSIYSLHNILDQPQAPGTLTESENVTLPDLVPCSLSSLEPNGVYLINNGEILVIYIREAASNEFIYNVFGMNTVQELIENPEYWDLAEMGTEESDRVIAVVEEVRRRNPAIYSAVYFCFQHVHDDIVRKLMVEDATPSEMCYSDYLLRLHKIVLNKISQK